MPNINHNINSILKETGLYKCTLVAVSKTKPVEMVQEAYDAGQRDFGENKVQELVTKNEVLPKDIRWHMIGHLQRNKVKQIAPFVHLIHSVDSLRLLETINKEGEKNDRKINCLLQVHIAQESTKFGFDEKEIMTILSDGTVKNMPNVQIKGLMGMATNTDDESLVSQEFSSLKILFDKINHSFQLPNLDMTELSMGMSGDYMLALKNGSTMIRVGSSIFGERNYA